MKMIWKLAIRFLRMWTRTSIKDVFRMGLKYLRNNREWLMDREFGVPSPRPDYKGYRRKHED
jgi:hypothetical protein